jgi:ATP-dependent RNA helicase RhlE
MFLKKINPDLSQALEEAGFTQPTSLQKATFGTLKSGADCVISASREEGKTTAIVINVIQRLEKEFEESPRALIIVQTKEKVQEVQELFKKFGKFTDLRVYGVHEKGDLDYDKNQISLGIDVLVGTPNRLSDMFSSAGFDVNQLKMFILDDAYEILKLRHDTRIARMSEGVLKMQRLFFTTQITDRVEALADRMMIEPNFFEFEEEEDDEGEEDADAETEDTTNETE